MPHADPADSAIQKTDAFHKGVQHFNSGGFFEAHEDWEEIWLQSPEPDKTFLQGIIQIAAAFHHHSQANHRGMRSLLEAGLGRLNRFPNIYFGIDLAALRDQATKWVAAIDEGRESNQTERLPQIILTP